MNEFAGIGDLQSLSLTRAEQMRLHKLQANLSSVQEATDSGILHPREASAIEQQIHASMDPLLARQAAAAQKQQQMEQQMRMHASAEQEAIAQQAAEARAQGFEKRIPVVTDPHTGKTAHFYEKKPNDWAQVEWPEDPEPLDFSAMGGGQDA